MTTTQTKRFMSGLAVLAAASAAIAQSSPPAGPSKEMAQLEVYKGSWFCHGSVPAGPYGPARKTTTSLVFRGDLDGRWLSGRIADMSAKDNPHPFKGVVGAMAGKEIASRDTFTRKGAGLQHLGEMQMDGKWVVVQDEICKRSAGEK